MLSNYSMAKDFARGKPAAGSLLLPLSFFQHTAAVRVQYFIKRTDSERKNRSITVAYYKHAMPSKQTELL